jgi:hypothetical protein
MSRHFVEVGGNIRPKIEALVELLVEILDQLDADDDLEDDDREADDDFESEPYETSIQPAHTADQGAWRNYHGKR